MAPVRRVSGENEPISRRAATPTKAGEVQSVNRALDILEAVGRAGESGVTALSGELGLATSTVHNLVRTLFRRGYLARDEGRYALGPMATVLSSQSDPAIGLSPVLGAALLRLSETTGHYSNARVLVGRTARQIAMEQGPGPITIRDPRASVPTALTVPTGAVLVAMTRPEHEWDDFIEDACGARTGSAATDWRVDLTRIAATGLAARRGPAPHGQVAVGVPVWTSGRRVVCAIGCSAPTVVTDEDAQRFIVHALWNTAVELSAALDCHDLPLSEPELTPDTWAVAGVS